MSVSDTTTEYAGYDRKRPTAYVTTHAETYSLEESFASAASTPTPSAGTSGRG